MKISIKRGTRSSESRAGSAVLEAPGETFASETSDVEEAMPMWHGRGPAPAGALQRGFGAAGYASPDGDETLLSETPAEKEYVPRRGSFAMRVRMLFRSVGGRIVLGVVVLVFLAAIVVAGVGIRSYLMHDERFLMTTSADIQIEGNEHLTRPQVLSIFGADLERNLFRVSLAERRADLERLPWVEHATVMRLLPNRIRVAVKERTPVAFVRQGTQIGLVDAGGVLLDMPPDAAGDPKYSFPVLTGISASDPLSTRAARMEIYKRFMTELDSTGEHLTRSLSEVDISNPEDVKAVVATGNSDILVHFGDEQFLDRYHEFSQHLTEWKTQYPKLASADMRYEGQIVLEMQTGAGIAMPRPLRRTQTQRRRQKQVLRLLTPPGKQRPSGAPVRLRMTKQNCLKMTNPRSLKMPRVLLSLEFRVCQLRAKRSLQPRRRRRPRRSLWRRNQ
jgi:cell division protein FtsQ